MSTTKPDEVLLKYIHRTFISGCHILHYQRVLDAYGHLSVRHPHKPSTFIMSRYIAPGTISSALDLVEYHVSDASPVDPNAPPGYSERCIHSEIYKAYPAVNSVCHSHSEAVVPYAISGVPMHACYHMAGFLGTRTPVWDIANAYQDGDTKDMLVRNTRLGASLAESFADTGNGGKPTGSEEEPPNSVVLMRGHGLSVCAKTIEDCVLRCVYTQKNAEIQTTALLTRSAYYGSGGAGKAQAEDEMYRPPIAGGLAVLSDEESAAAKNMTLWSAHRPWRLWVREVEAAGMYVNLII